MLSNPLPIIAIVFPPAAKHPKCEKLSIPLAKPLTIFNPAFARLYEK